jgi:deazaflavin-dependent oxidoreductase (nitroreductase family)
VRLTRILPKRLIGGSFFTAVGKRVIPRSDLALQRATRGRLSLTTAIGMPFLLLETTGRRTGRPRVTPLTYATQGTDILVVGSNWGQPRQPAWALNLRAKPEAVAVLRGKRIPVTARTLAGAERAEAWQLLLAVWPAYDDYVERVQVHAAREIMVFRLERDS